MDAKKTWDLWRRILREPALAERLFEQDFESEAARFGMSPEDVRIARAYAATPKATQFLVATYRYRLTSSFGHALQSAAPLTYRALRASGQDLRSLGERCLDALGWVDMGPYVYRFGAAILEYLRESELAATVPGLPETTALEGASVALVRRLAEAPAAAWVPRAERETQGKELTRYRFRLTGTGVVVRIERSLTPWLRDWAQIGKTPLEDQPEWYLLHLPSPEESPRVVPIGATGATLFSLLAERATPELPGEPPPEASLPVTLAELVELARAAGIARPQDPLRWIEKYIALGVVSGQPMDS